MTTSSQREILLIWVNAERQFERDFIAALGASDFFSEPHVIERDAHQAEIAARAPDRRDILEAIIDALYELSGFDVHVQGAEKERLPTVVFSAEPTQGRQKAKPKSRVRRHVDDPLDGVKVTRRTPERILSTSEMAAQARAPVPTPQHIRVDVVDERDSGGIRPSTDSNVSHRRSAGDGLIPLIVRVAKFILIEEEPENEESSKQEAMVLPTPTEEGKQIDE